MHPQNYWFIPFYSKPEDRDEIVWNGVVIDWFSQKIIYLAPWSKYIWLELSKHIPHTFDFELVSELNPDICRNNTGAILISLFATVMKKLDLSETPIYSPADFLMWRNSVHYHVCMENRVDIEALHCQHLQWAIDFVDLADHQCSTKHFC